VQVYKRIALGKSQSMTHVMIYSFQDQSLPIKSAGTVCISVYASQQAGNYSMPREDI
jgi:hypothetical protein